MAGFLWLASDNKIPVDDYGLPWVAAFMTLYAGLTMVSNVPFYSFKTINLRRSVPFTVIFLIVLGFVLISFDPPIVLFLLFVAYGLSGYVYWICGRSAALRSSPPSCSDGSNPLYSARASHQHSAEASPRQPASCRPAAAPAR